MIILRIKIAIKIKIKIKIKKFKVDLLKKNLHFNIKKTSFYLIKNFVSRYRETLRDKNKLKKIKIIIIIIYKSKMKIKINNQIL